MSSESSGGLKPAFQSIEHRVFVIDLDFDPQDPERDAAKPVGHDFQRILLGRKPEHIRFVEISTIFRRVFMMIAKPTLHDDVRAQGLERPMNGGRPCDTGQQPDRPISQRFQRHPRRSIERNQLDRPAPRPNNLRSHAVEARKSLRFTLVRILIEPSPAVHETKPIGSAQRRDRFAQRTGREEPAIAKAPRSIDAYDVDVASESMMLKSIVEYDDLRIEYGYRVMPNNTTISSNQYRNARRMGGENE